MRNVKFSILYVICIYLVKGYGFALLGWVVSALVLGIVFGLTAEAGIILQLFFPWFVRGAVLVSCAWTTQSLYESI